MINRRPPHGSSSSAESGVCPNLSRYGFEGFLLRLRTTPRSMTMSCSYARPSTSIDPNPQSRTSITYLPYPPPGDAPRGQDRLGWRAGMHPTERVILQALVQHDIVEAAPRAGVVLGLDRVACLRDSRFRDRG